MKENPGICPKCGADLLGKYDMKDSAQIDNDHCLSEIRITSNGISLIISCMNTGGQEFGLTTVPRTWILKEGAE
jgi:hypothetical protein